MDKYQIKKIVRKILLEYTDDNIKDYCSIGSNVSVEFYNDNTVKIFLSGGGWSNIPDANNVMGD